MKDKFLNIEEFCSLLKFITMALHTDDYKQFFIDNIE